MDTQNWVLSFFVPIMVFFGWKRVEFPLAEECRMKFFAQRWGRTAICWSIIVLVVFIAMPYFQGWNRTATKLAVIAIGIAAILPQVIFETFFPRWFDVTASKDRTDYEFQSEDYANEFFVLNRDAYPDADILVDGEPV